MIEIFLSIIWGIVSIILFLLAVALWRGDLNYMWEKICKWLQFPWLVIGAIIAGIIFLIEKTRKTNLAEIKNSEIKENIKTPSEEEIKNIISEAEEIKKRNGAK